MTAIKNMAYWKAKNGLSSPAKQGVIWGPKGEERMMDAFGKETQIEKQRRKKSYRKPGESQYQASVRRNK